MCYISLQSTLWSDLSLIVWEKMSLSPSCLSVSFQSSVATCSFWITPLVPTQTEEISVQGVPDDVFTERESDSSCQSVTFTFFEDKHLHSSPWWRALYWKSFHFSPVWWELSAVSVVWGWHLEQNTAARCLTGLCYYAQMRFVHIRLIIWHCLCCKPKERVTLQLTESKWHCVTLKQSRKGACTLSRTLYGYYKG